MAANGVHHLAAFDPTFGRREDVFEVPEGSLVNRSSGHRTRLNKNLGSVILA